MTSRFGQGGPIAYGAVPMLLLALGGMLWLGCKRTDPSPTGEHEAIMRSLSAAYDGWLRLHRPFLTNLNAAIVYQHQCSILHREGRPLPFIEYSLKVGEWQGLIILGFVLDVDQHDNPISLRERRVTFIELPARRVVAGEGGRRRTEYCGLYLLPNEMEDIVGRAIRGDAFEDLRKRADADRLIVYSRFEDTDDWRGLTVK